MSDTLFPPFLHWGDYTSKNEKKPNVLLVEPQEIDTFETEYSINMRVKINGKEKVLPLHSFESKNRQLLQKFNDARKQNKIKVGKKFKLHTWLGISKNNFPIRRFELVF